MSLKVNLIRDLARIIESQPDVGIAEIPSDPKGFSMEKWQHMCGAPACIGGWAVAMMCTVASVEESLDPYDLENSVYSALMTHMGLTFGQVKELTQPSCSFARFNADPSEPGHITASHAAAVLYHLADTGNVDWRVGAEEEAP